jgi:hypothetical protein
MAMDAGLTAPDQRAREAAEALKAARRHRQEISGLLREDQNPGAIARVADTRDNNPAAPGLP